VPSQVLGLSDFFFAEQTAGAQTVAASYRRHAPEPLHLPSRPQIAGASVVQPPRGSGAPAGTLAQLPAKPGTLQALHSEQLAEPQQTPSTQLPLSHSSPPEQAAPSTFFLQIDPRQTYGATQSLS
jgi:hypothetical protein